MPELEQGGPEPTHATRAIGDIDGTAFRQTLGRFLSGVTVVTAVDPRDGRAHAMTASAFVSVSLAPPLVLVSLDRRTRMIDVVERAERWAVSILDEHQGALARHFAGQPDPVDGAVACERSGVPVLSESLAYLVMRKVELREAGDHVLVLGHVEELGYQDDGTPLAYFGGHFYRITPTEAHVLVAWSSPGDPVWM